MKTFNLKSVMMSLALVFLVGFWGCNDENVDYKGPSVEVDQTSLTFETGGGKQILTVRSNRNWEATLEGTDVGTWLQMSPAQGSGDGKIEVTALPMGESVTLRTAIIKLVASTLTLTIPVSQGDGGVVGGTPIYKENCGTEVQQENGRWPYTDQYTGWERGGSKDQSAVTYSGSGANVSNSGPAFDPADGSSFSGAPYVGMSYSASSARMFQISKINIQGVTDLTFTFGAIFQNAYSGGATFGPVTAQTFVLSVSVDGSAWAEVPYSTSADPAGGNWYLCTTAFKVPEGSTELYVKFEPQGLVSNQGTRVDDFTLYEGGNGDLINPGSGGSTELTPITIKELTDRITSTETPVGNYKLTAIVVTDMTSKNYSSGGISIQTEGSNTAGNGILLYKYDETFKDGSGAPMFAVGDEIEIDLSEAKLIAYKGAAAQADDPACNELEIANTSCITKTGRNVTIAPTTITPDQLADFQSMYVQIENAQSNETSVSTWAKNTTVFNVNNDPTKEFNVYVNQNATTIVGKDFLTGNGTIKGLAYVYGGSKSSPSAAQLVPRDYDDVSGLTGPRVGTTVPAFTVSPLTEDVPATGGEVTVNITANVAWTATTLTGADYIESVTPTSGTGSETVKVVFKKNTDTENARTATIQFATTEAVETQSYTVTFTQDKAAGVGTDGTFAASWNMTTIENWGPTQMPVTSAPADVTIGDLTKHGFTSSGNLGAGNWGGTDFSDNLEDIVLTAPVKYATFTVSAAGKTLSLSSLAAVVRITKTAPTAVSIQYSLDGTTFAEAGRLTYTRPSKTTTFPVQSVDLSGVAALQNVAAGTTVTIRIVPVATEGTTTGNFYLHSDDETTPALELTGTLK